MKIDFHSHFLPGIDDGARTPAESVAILKYLKSCGIRTVCATPHYSPNHESVQQFLERRYEAFKTLLHYIDGNGVSRDELPKLVPGAEVALYPRLSEQQGLEKLCYGDTRFLLLELPFREYEHWESEELYNVMYQFKITPVMAHINRYYKLFGSEDFSEIFLNDDVILQINSESALDILNFKKSKKFIKSDLGVVFGCDIHRSDKIGESGLEKLTSFLAKVPEHRKAELSSLEKYILGSGGQDRG